MKIKNCKYYHGTGDYRTLKTITKNAILDSKKDSLHDLLECDDHDLFEPNSFWLTSSKLVAQTYFSRGFESEYKSDNPLIKSINLPKREVPNSTKIKVFYRKKGSSKFPSTKTIYPYEKLPKEALTPTKKLKKNTQIQVLLPNGQEIFDINKDFSSVQAAIKSANELLNKELPCRKFSKVIKFNINTKNTKIIDMKGERFKRPAKVARAVYGEGFDSVLFKNVYDVGNVAYGNEFISDVLAVHIDQVELNPL